MWGVKKLGNKVLKCQRFDTQSLNKEIAVPYYRKKIS